MKILDVRHVTGVIALVVMLLSLLVPVASAQSQPPVQAVSQSPRQVSMTYTKFAKKWVRMNKAGNWAWVKRHTGGPHRAWTLRQLRQYRKVAHHYPFGECSRMVGTKVRTCWFGYAIFIHVKQVGPHQFRVIRVLMED